MMEVLPIFEAKVSNSKQSDIMLELKQHQDEMLKSYNVSMQHIHALLNCSEHKNLLAKVYMISSGISKSSFVLDDNLLKKATPLLELKTVSTINRLQSLTIPTSSDNQLQIAGNDDSIYELTQSIETIKQILGVDIVHFREHNVNIVVLMLIITNNILLRTSKISDSLNGYASSILQKASAELNKLSGFLGWIGNFYQLIMKEHNKIEYAKDKPTPIADISWFGPSFKEVFKDMDSHNKTYSLQDNSYISIKISGFNVNDDSFPKDTLPIKVDDEGREYVKIDKGIIQEFVKKVSTIYENAFPSSKSDITSEDGEKYGTLYATIKNSIFSLSTVNTASDIVGANLSNINSELNQNSQDIQSQLQNNKQALNLFNGSVSTFKKVILLWS